MGPPIAVDAVEEDAHAMSDVADPIQGAKRIDVGGVTADEVPAGDARVRRLVYAPGWRWSTDMQPVVGTPFCMHAHVGFLAQGAIGIRYADGCTEELRAPAFVVIEPNHDGWVVGDETAVLIQVDCGRETLERFGMTGEHAHA
jgi:hypothetical protein